MSTRPAAPRVLLIAHGHPDFSLGGGELAAHAEWRELRRRGIEAMLVARTAASPRHTGAAFSLRSSDGMEVLFSAPAVNHFRHSQPHRRVVTHEFRALLERFRPTVVHFHHYVHLGLELIREVRRSAPEARIVLTLHEYLAMCHAQGQMLKTSGLLCERAAPLDCSQCFPEVSPQDIFMRELFVKSFLNLCDHFVCPSRFLRDRYVAWGLPAERMRVIENGQPNGPPAAATAGALAAAEPIDAALHTRFVVLGQLSRLKGTLVLLEAVRLLPKRVQRLLRVEIHGSMQYETAEFKSRFDAAVEAVRNTVHAAGPYRPADVQSIIARAGWVIQPSIWWENSPLVIQEAFAGGRPVLCSNIGGMAEKVTHGVNGLHFRAGSAADLAARLEEGATQRALWERLRAGVPRPPVIGDTVGELLALYGSPRAA